MDVMTALAQIPGIGPVLPYLVALVGICVALAACLPPPKVAGSFYARVYAVIDFIGVNVGHATNATAPGQVASPTIPKSAAALFILSLGGVMVFGLAACSEKKLATGSTVLTEIAPVVAEQVVTNATPPTLANLQKGCSAYQLASVGAKTQTHGGASQTATSMAAPGDAFCKIVDQGKVPDNADSNSVPWMSLLSVALNTLKAFAG